MGEKQNYQDFLQGFKDEHVDEDEYGARHYWALLAWVNALVHSPTGYIFYCHWLARGFYLTIFPNLSSCELILNEARPATTGLISKPILLSIRMRFIITPELEKPFVSLTVRMLLF